MTVTDSDMPDFQIRPERPADHAAVHELQRAAFGEDRVPHLVAALRTAPAALPPLSFVAVAGDRVVGHVMLSAGRLDSPVRIVDVMELSPLGVLPEFQKQGVGTALVAYALTAAEAAGIPLVFLEGSPRYYGSRGFERADELGFRSPSLRIPDVAFQVARLSAHESWMTGTYVYSETFWALDCVGLRAPLRTFEAKNGWQALRDRLSDRVAETDLVLLDEAVAFAVARHGDQRRPAGEPYLEHLLEAVAVLAEGVGMTDADILRAAVLHDVVEDTDCALEEVADRFGERVATLVDWVTKAPAAPSQSREEVRAAYLDRLREAPADALAVKLADRLSNVQRLDTHPRPRKSRDYYRETVRSIVPLTRSHPWFCEWFAAWREAFRHLDAADGEA